MAKKYLFETYETLRAEHLDEHLEAAYNDGWMLLDNIRMQFMYSVTLFKVVEEEEELPWGPDSAAEIVNTTTGTEDEYYCVSCGSRNVLSAEIHINAKHYVERVCGDCHSDAIAIYKKY